MTRSILLAAALCAAGAATAQDNSADLAKKLSNPVADLISVPSSSTTMAAFPRAMETRPT